jgi:hypothetical protein
MTVKFCKSLVVLCLRLAAASMPSDDDARLRRAFSNELRELALKNKNT